MEALGNDFIVINAIDKKINPSSAMIQKIANRHFGIGADQVLVIERSQQNADFNYRIFNADGTKAEQCLNGARCVALYLQQKKITKKRKFKLSCLAGILSVQLGKKGIITVQLVSNFKLLPIPEALKKIVKIEVLGAIDIGNPHLILRVNSIAKAPITLASLIIKQHYFKNGINITFVEIVTPRHIKLRTYERGTGETLACGSGAVATVMTGRLCKLLDKNVTVEFCCGTLIISWLNSQSPILIKGDAKMIFEGII